MPRSAPARIHLGIGIEVFPPKKTSNMEIVKVIVGFDCE
jgi:hypothetical protein